MRKIQQVTHTEGKSWTFLNYMVHKQLNVHLLKNKRNRTFSICHVSTNEWILSARNKNTFNILIYYFCFENWIIHFWILFSLKGKRRLCISLIKEHCKVCLGQYLHLPCKLLLTQKVTTFRYSEQHCKVRDLETIFSIRIVLLWNLGQITSSLAASQDKTLEWRTPMKPSIMS